MQIHALHYKQGLLINGVYKLKLEAYSTIC